MNNKLVLFQEKQIRRIWHNEEWHFSVVDVIEVLSNSPTPRKYWNTLKTREPQLSSVCGQLKMLSADGKNYKTDAANTEGVLRIIMSVPSPKAEPFKLWLAQVGTERMAEIENPELALERAFNIYKEKGYPDEWIAMRVKSIDIRNQLTDEWKNRGVQEGMDYSILTAEIAKATFGITPSEHKKVKGLHRENLRDHMTNLELIFSMLGEEATRTIAENEDAQGFDENHDAAMKGGNAAGEARRNMEKVIKRKVVSPKNFKQLDNPEDMIEKLT